MLVLLVSTAAKKSTGKFNAFLTLGDDVGERTDNKHMGGL